jgi:hypothetical protein
MIIHSAHRRCLTLSPVGKIHPVRRVLSAMLSKCTYWSQFVQSLPTNSKQWNHELADSKER